MFKSGMCNTTEFRLGEKYLVYADGPASEVLYGNTCSRTRHISWAQEDLKYLDGLARAPRGSRIFGSVLSMYGSDGSQKVFAGARVDVAGEGVSRSAKTDRQGRYQVRGLPPGKYAISTKVQGWTLDGPELVKTVDRGCMELDLVLLPGNDERIHQ